MTFSSDNYLSVGDSIGIQLYENQPAVTIRFVDANETQQTQDALHWITEEPIRHRVVGIDLEWIAELPWEPRTNKHKPISLLQLAVDDKCILFTTRGVSSPAGAPYIRCKSSVFIIIYHLITLNFLLQLSSTLVRIVRLVWVIVLIKRNYG